MSGRSRLSQPLSMGRQYRAALLGACCAVFLFSLCFQVGVALERTLFNAAFYRALAHELEAPARVQEYLLAKLFTRAGLELRADSFVYRAAAAAASPEWLEQQLDRATDEAVAFLKGEEATLVVALDLRERKEVFQAALTARLSAATLERLEVSDQFVRTLIEQAGLPDRYLLLQLSPAENTASGLLPALQAVGRARRYFRLVPGLALGALLLVCPAWGGTGRGLRLYGAALSAGGLIGLIGLCGPGVPALLSALAPHLAALEGAAGGAGLLFGPLFFDAAAGLLRQLLRFVPLCVLAAGLFLFLVGLSAAGIGGKTDGTG